MSIEVENRLTPQVMIVFDVVFKSESMLLPLKSASFQIANEASRFDILVDEVLLFSQLSKGVQNNTFRIEQESA